MVKRVLMVLVALVLLGLAGRYVYLELEGEPVCDVCRRPLREQTSFRIELKDGATEQVCCPRCGLRFMSGRDDVLAAEAADYETGERLAARKAFYVEGSSVHLCCGDLTEKDRSGAQYDLVWDRCLPSLIAFETREEAEAFSRLNGGVVKAYGELLQEFE